MDVMRSNADWMGELSEYLLNVPLNQIALPGTHDSGTYCLNNSCDYAPDAPPFLLKNWFFGAAAKPIVIGWSITQSRTVKQQLKDGVRYLDFRVAPDSKETLYLVHGLFGPQLEDALQQVAKFVKKHPKEVVIIDFNHFYGMSTKLHRSLMATIHSIFKESLASSNRGPTATLREFWDAGESVICIYWQPSLHTEFTDKLWPHHTIKAPWANTMDVTNLHAFISQAMSSQHEQRFNVCQWVLSPTPKTIAGMFAPYTASNIMDLAKCVSPILSDWLNKYIMMIDDTPVAASSPPYEFPNIIICDYYDTFEFIELVKQINIARYKYRNVVAARRMETIIV